MTRMSHTLLKRAAMLGVAGVITAGAVAPSLAQTVVVPERPYYGAERPYYGANDPTTRRGSILNQSPTECWTDEGYGRTTACDAGGNSGGAGG